MLDKDVVHPSIYFSNTHTLLHHLACIPPTPSQVEHIFLTLYPFAIFHPP